MAEQRRVLITGASRGLGVATAAHLHRRGWTVIAAMRDTDAGLANITEALGGDCDSERLVGVTLDLLDPTSIAAAAGTVLHEVGVPDGVVHNAGVTAVGASEEMPVDLVEQIMATNLLGPIRLTRELLPAMRGAGTGRIVAVSSESATLGMPGISAYSASKSALERWAEALSVEVSPFGIGVTVLVTGTFKTDILELTKTWKDPDGPYAQMHDKLEGMQERVLRLAASPDRFAPAVERALGDKAPLKRRAVGIDAKAMVYGSKVMPAAAMSSIASRIIGLPRPGSLRRSATARLPITSDPQGRHVPRR